MPRFASSAVLVSAIAVAAPSLGAQRAARDTISADSLAAQRLRPVVTTATRAPVRATELPQRIETISRADIERTPAADAVDVLKKTAAVDVIQYPSLLGGVGIRGFRPATGGINQRTMILIDGRPAGAYNLALVDLATVERIEVLKGPASALYGSNAMGGVVNLITRRSSGRPAGTVSALYGSFGTSEYALRGGGTIAGALDGDVSFRLYDQGGDYRMGSGNVFRDLLGGDKARKRYPLGNKPDRDVSDTLGDGAQHGFSGYGTRAGSARLGYAFSEHARADVRGELVDANDVLTPGDLYAQATTSPGNARKNVGRQSLDASVTRRAGRHDALVRAYTARETGENFDKADAGRFVNFSSESTTGGAQLQDQLSIGAHALTLGADYTDVHAHSHRYSDPRTEIGTFSPNSGVRSLAAFAQGRWHGASGRLAVTGGLRADRITLDVEETPLRPDVSAGRETFGVVNPNAGIQWLDDSGLRVHATAGRAFVTPDAFSRAAFAQAVTANVAAITVGNPGVDPERSITIDGGIGIVKPRIGLEADATYFHTSVADRITRARASFAASRRPTTAEGIAVGRVETSVNAGDATIEGVEARLTYDLGLARRRAYSLRVFANATRILRAEERTPAVSIDTARFGGATNFDPRRVFAAFVFGATGAPARVRNIADLTVTSGVEYDDLRRFAVRLGGRYVGSRLDSDFTDAADVSDIEYPPFLVVDASGALRVVRGVHLELAVSNLTDENYYEKRGYNLPGRSIRLRLRADW
jgi:outer membrane receptor protein involved in Fe transport